MTGNLRSWIHYINLRTANGTQKEHMEIAELCKRHFVCQFPTVAEALGWCDNTCDCPEHDDPVINLHFLSHDETIPLSDLLHHEQHRQPPPLQTVHGILSE